MDTDLPPIAVIRQKELELADRIAAAKCSSEQAVKDARAGVEELVREAERRASGDADELLRTQRAAIDLQVQQLSDRCARKIAQIAEHGARIQEQAVRKILDAVAPDFGDT